MRVVIAGIVIFIYGMLASMLGTIVPGLGSEFALTNLQISYLALAQGIGLAGTSVFAGALMDRSGRKVGIVLGLCAAVTALAILSHPKSLAACIVAMAIMGVGGSLVIVGANALVNDVNGKSKAAALNILNLFVGLGGMATPFVAGNLLHSDPTKVAYCGAGIAVLALVLTLATRIPKLEITASEAPSQGVFDDKRLYILSTITFLYTACEFAMWNWLPRFLIAAGVPAVKALDILSLGFASGMLLGRLGAAKLLTKASPFGVILAASLVMGLTTFSMLHATSVAMYAWIIFFAGVAMAPVFPTTIAIVGRLFQQKSATAIGFAITCGFSGLVLSSPVIGALAGPDPRGIGNALLLVPVLSLVIAATLIAFRRTLTLDAEGNPI